MKKSFLSVLFFFIALPGIFSQTKVSRTNGTSYKKVQKNKVQQKKSDNDLLNSQTLVHQNFYQLTNAIATGKFSPPVASRIYSYASLAAYEALRFERPGAKSLVKDLKGFEYMPEPNNNKKYNYSLAATKALLTVAKKLTSYDDSLNEYENKIYRDIKNMLEKDSYENSLQFGESIGNAILERAKIDRYTETRAMAKYMGSQETGKWRRTPSGYMHALEPNWGQIMPLVLDSAAEIKSPLPPSYSLEKTSAFYKATNEVYEIGINLTDEQKRIAKYWDDNPLVKEDSTHPMFGKKKITPVAHWIGIAGIACKMKKMDALETAKTIAITSIAMHDAIITTWSQKYIHNVIRPVTVINEFIDSNWHSYLQTPPTPEHSSGHSSISAAAATILTHTFGDNFAFEDTSDLAYTGMQQSFSSFNSAAQEVSISRVYGGIHYRTGIEAGAAQGRAVGKYVIRKLLQVPTRLKKDKVQTRKGKPNRKVA